MHCHAQSTGGRAVDKYLWMIDFKGRAGLQISHCLVNAEADIARGDAGRRESLGKMLQNAPRPTLEAVGFGDRRADLDGQNLNIHGTSRLPRAS